MRSANSGRMSLVSRRVGPELTENKKGGIAPALFSEEGPVKER